MYNGSFGMGDLSLGNTNAMDPREEVTLSDDHTQRLGDWAHSSPPPPSPIVTPQIFNPSAREKEDVSSLEDWGITVRETAFHTMVACRKRKASKTLDSSEMGSPSRHKFAGHMAHENSPLYSAMRSQESFLELQFELMTDCQLRTAAQVSVEWCRIAYMILRRRKGNRAFTLLWSVGPSSNSIVLNSHFHDSFIQGSKTPVGPFGAGSEHVVLKNVKGYLPRAKAVILEPVQNVLTFGNVEIQDELINAEEWGEMPQVKMIIQVLSQGIFYTTPNLQKLGDSFEGIFGQVRDVRGGKCVSSLCFPKSTHLSMDAFIIGNEGVWSISEQCGQTVNPWATPKAILMFKVFDDSKIDEWIKEKLTQTFATQNGATPFVTPVISGLYSFIGSNVVRQGATVPDAIALCLMGDELTRVHSTQLNFKGDGEDVLNKKLKDMEYFIKTKDPFHPGNYSIFALMFTTMGASSLSESEEVTEAYRLIQDFLAKFHKYFPWVPIQGIVSHADVTYQEGFEVVSTPLTPPGPFKDTRDAHLQSSGTVDNFGKLVVLIVKYPETLMSGIYPPPFRRKSTVGNKWKARFSMAPHSKLGLGIGSPMFP